MINKKLDKLKKYDEFLKKVQFRNQDMFIELQDITNRHQVLSDSNELLRRKRNEKDNESEQISKEMEEYIKTMTIKIVSNNNMIA